MFISARAAAFGALLAGCFLAVLGWRHYAGSVAREPAPLLDGRPGRILEGVYTLGNSGPLTLYAVRAGDTWVLVDAGYARDVPRIRQAMRSLGLDPGRIGHLLLTHLHIDHVQAAALIQRDSGARIYAGAADARVLERGAEGGTSWELLNPGRLPFPDAALPPLRVDQALVEGLEGGEILPIPGVRIRAIATPGHTPGHVSYLLETQGRAVLFSGDAVESFHAEFGTAPATLHSRHGGDPRAYLRTLGRLRDVAVDVLLPAHPAEDLQKTGQAPNPFLGPGAWKARLQDGVDFLETLLARQQADGADFLGDAAFRIRPGLLYLGTAGGPAGAAAVYALETSSGLVLVDPGPAGNADFVWAGLGRLGHGPRELRGVLLTAADPDLAGAVAELGLAGELDLYAGQGLATEETPGRVRRRVVRDGDVLDLGDTRVRVLATPPGRAERRIFVVDWPEGKAAFTGKAVRPLTLDGDLVGDLPVEPEAAPALADLLTRAAEVPVALWLPARPFAEQNANLYDAAWKTILRRNLEHAP